jgi:alanyl-tRNA synthetase
MQSKEILETFLNFYKERGHMQVPNVSLVPEGDSTLLFVNSGMFPLVPYLSGEKHPLGKRLVNVQRSLRFEDMDEIGDATHTIAFHMIGNWSLGDYFKKEQLPWVYEFLVEKLKLDPRKLFATVFEGDEFSPKDTESIEIIKEVFKKFGIDAQEGNRIFPAGRGSNWWQRGDAVGELGGPDSEVFYYIGNGSSDGKSPVSHENEFLEIGNSVFMQYRRTENGWEELPQKNVDFGGGLERLALVAQGKKDIFETDNFWPIIEKIQSITDKKYSDPQCTKYMRILADHMRAACFLAMDGVVPSNKDQGYVLRRLLRRMVRAGRQLGVVSTNLSVELVPVVANMFEWFYPQIKENQEKIEKLFEVEETKFKKTLLNGTKEVSKIFSRDDIDMSIENLAKLSFDLYQSLGYPSEIFLDDAREHGAIISIKEFDKEFQKTFDSHQEKSRTGAEKKFKGGLADQSETVIKYHTTTHLLQRALKIVLGEHVRQIGSNITGERLRFDFPNAAKLTEEQIKEVEALVNDSIEKELPVNFQIMPIGTAKTSGALYLPQESYPDPVKVYYIGNSFEDALSKEFCGGPHVQNTKELAPIKIFKQESIGEGKQRVYVRFA